MSDVIKIIEEIDWKVRKLISDKDSLRTELQRKCGEIEALQSQIEKLINENKELKEHITINSLTNTINNRSDISDSRKVINDLLKRIDKSISIITQSNERREPDNKD